MQIVEQIFCVVMGFVFLRVAYRWLDKPDKLGQAFLFFLVAIGFFVCTLSGVQNLIKTNILWRFTKSLEEYGNKIDTFQTSVTEMRDDLKKQQLLLASNQTTLATIQAQIQKAQIGVTYAQQGITSQYSNITHLQDQISSGQSNLNVQQKQLSDVSYWVQNLFDKTTNETFTARDTDHLSFGPSTEGTSTACIRLSNVPIKNSVTVYVRDASSLFEQRFPIANPVLVQNIITANLVSFNTNSLRISVNYVTDIRETNLYQRMPIWGKELTSTNGITTITRPPLP